MTQSRQEAKTDAAWLVIKLATDKLSADELRDLTDRVLAEGAKSNYVPLHQAMGDAAFTLHSWAEERAA